MNIVFTPTAWEQYTEKRLADVLQMSTDWFIMWIVTKI